VPDRTQLPLNVPPSVLLVARAKVPVGVIAVPVEVSVTVTVHEDPWLTLTGDVQFMVVDVVRPTAATLTTTVLALVP